MMRAMHSLPPKKALLLAVLLLAGLCARVACAADAVSIRHRYALVIGNAQYRVPANVLLNPAHDAALVSDTLRQQGFEVIRLVDQSRAQMEQAVDDFAQRARGADLALVYYAGHAVAIDGINYLFGVDLGMPLGDVNISSAQQSALSMKVILMTLNRAKIRARLLVLDACRVNLTRGADMAGTLAKVVPAGGELIAFSTQPGATAEDGFAARGGPQNSPYAYYFSSRLQSLSPNESVENFFKQVTGDVQTVTQYRQIPSYSASLVGDVTFISYRDATTTASSSADTMSRRKRGVDASLSRHLLWMRLDDWAIDIERAARNADAATLQSMLARAEMGDVMAITELGLVAGLGKIVPKDDAEAKRRFEQASKMGFPLAKTYLAAMLWQGKTPAELAQVRAEGERLLREAWDGGSHRAARQLLLVQGILDKRADPADLRRYDDEAYEYVRQGGDPLNMKMQKNGICPADMSVRECMAAHPEIPLDRI